MPPSDGAPFRCGKYVVDGKVEISGMKVDNLVRCNKKSIGMIPEGFEPKDFGGRAVCAEHWAEVKTTG